MKRYALFLLLLTGCASSQVSRYAGGIFLEKHAMEQDVTACEADRAFSPTFMKTHVIGETYCETALKKARCWMDQPEYSPPWYDRTVRGFERPFCERFGKAPESVTHKPLG